MSSRQSSNERIVGDPVFAFGVGLAEQIIKYARGFLVFLG